MKCPNCLKIFLGKRICPYCGYRLNDADIQSMPKEDQAWLRFWKISERHRDSFREAIIAAVNHDGDSDSTGAVTGIIIGAYLGIKRISHKYLENLELYDMLVDIADRMK